MFDSYNARRNGATTIGNESLNYDFSKCEGKIEFCIGGHIHVDHDFTSTEGIPVILTRTDSYHWRLESGSTSSEGSNQESAVSAIIADYDNKKVNIIRIGRGSSRIVNLSELPASGGGSDEPEIEEPTNYTNILKTVGYKANTRCSTTSYEEKMDDKASGLYLTGFIGPLTLGDVVRFKNITISKTGEGDTHNRIYGFDTDKNGLASDQISNIKDGQWWKIVWDSNNNLSSLAYGGFNNKESGYIRLNASYIDDKSIITINEEID